MNFREIEKIVEETISELPEEFAQAMENVGIIVETWPSEEELASIRAHKGVLLFGLYRGVPKTKRLSSSYTAVPDKIIIFAGPILMISRTIEEAKAKIRETVLHEIGHHFGMSEESIQSAMKS